MPPMRNLDLESAAAELVKRLGGHWNGKFGLCRCPAHDDTDPSLSVRAGSRSLLFKCFAGCDTVAVLRAIRRLRLDIPANDNDVPPLRRSRDDRLALRVRELWDDARPMRGSPAEIYARSRGFAGTAATLRYHPRTPLGSSRRKCCPRPQPAST